MKTTPRLVWIEASAGTGKTYRIKNIVHDLVAEGLGIRRLLVVTFTEKAAEELRLRLREVLQEGVDDSSLDDHGRENCRRALLEFSGAAITTIHGFCRALLANYPFESGLAFRTEVKDLGDETERRLRAWLKEKLEDLPAELLLWTGWDEPAKFYEKAVQALASDLLEKPVFAPTPRQAKLFDKARSELGDPNSQVNRLIAILDAETERLKGSGGKWEIFSKEYDGILNGTKVKSLLVAFKNLPRIQDDPRSPRTALSLAGAWADLAKDSLQNKKRHPLEAVEDISSLADFLFKKDTGKPAIQKKEEFQKKYFSWFDTLVKLAEALSELFPENPGMGALPGSARYFWLFSLASEWKTTRTAWEQSRDVLTFDAMIERVRDLVDDLDSSFSQKVREQFDAALIDEFQDTDESQWRIFSRLFLDGKHLLYLVGDPKQSIYGFRGADLAVYERARRELENLGASIEPLDQNWRSTAASVETVNHLFSKVNFGLEDVAFKKVGAANRKAPVLVRRIGDSAFVQPAVRVEILGKKKDSDEKKLNFAALRHSWIRRCSQWANEFLDGSWSLRHEDASGNSVERPLTPADILILTDDNASSKLLYSLLSKAGIPASVSTQEGLWETDGAFWAGVFLQAAESERPLAFLRLLAGSPLFSSAADQIELEVRVSSLQNLWPDVRKDFDRGDFVRAASRWTTDGLLSRTGGLRLFTDFQHSLELLQSLHSRGEIGESGAASAWTALLAGRNRGVLPVDLRLDNDAAAVRIMTIHKAKGLEAPVVLLAAGLKQRRNDSDWYVFPFEGSQHADFLKTSEGKIADTKERDAEDRRLYYVALTRSISHQIIYDVDTWRGSRGIAGNKPPEQRWGRFLHALEPTENKSATESADASAEPRLFPGKSVDGLSLAEEDFFFFADQENPEEPKGSQPKQPESSPCFAVYEVETLAEFSFEARYPHVFSHTGLVRQDGSNGQSFDPSDLKPERQTEVDAIDAPPAFDGLPAGKVFGVIVHEILERLDYRAWADPETSPDLSILRRNQETKDAFFEILDANPAFPSGAATRTTLWDFLGRALNSPLPLSNDNLPLAGLAEEKTRRETEFILPLEGPVEGWTWKWRPPGGLEGDFHLYPGYLKGVFDLLFVHNGEVWILDWKTNRIGPEQTPNEVFRQARYDLQAYLYALALQRSMRGSQPLAGVIFYFLRNAQGQPEPLVFRFDEVLGWDSALITHISSEVPT